MAKSGTRFEALIAWIEKTAAQHATVVPNAKIQDRQTGKLRQIDVAIYIKEGHHTLLVIVEVRDRSQPVGSPYIEEVSGKAKSVGANATMIVSKSGFTKPAAVKAQCLGIRALTYQQATEKEWLKWCKATHLVVYHRHFEVKHVRPIIEFDGNFIEEIEDGLLDMLRENPSAPAFVLLSGDRIGALNLIKQAVDQHPEIWTDISPDAPATAKPLRIKPVPQAPIAFPGKFRPIPIRELQCMLELKVTTEELLPIHRQHLKDTSGRETPIEVLETKMTLDGRRVLLEMVAPGAVDYIPAGGVLSMRISELKEEDGV
jgi:hypothetical protein